MDAEFIRGFGVASGDMPEFRRLVRDNLEREAGAKIQAEIRRQVMEQLLAANPVDLPTVMVAQEAAGLQADGDAQSRHQGHEGRAGHERL